MLLEREGRRLWLTLAPLGLIPLRLAVNDGIAWSCAGALVAVIAAPDLYRAALWLVTAKPM